jgi:hypothetical protein
MRRAALIGAVLACALSACGEDQRPAVPERAAALEAERPAADLPPLPADHEAKVVEPVAGATEPEVADEPVEQAPPTDAPKPKRAASPSVHLSRPTTAGDGVHKATALPNGIALPPLEAPAAVRSIIEAGNAIARAPYKWGGGHGRWLDTGYDCSGSVSFALASAGLLSGPLDSGRLMSWGSPGPGRWITIWSNPGHVFLVVAGVRFDTSGTRTTGSRWQASMRSTAGFVARHPSGL